MSAIGGSLENVSFAGRIFPVVSDADTQRGLGGRSLDLLPNGDGSQRIISTHSHWSLEGLVLSCDDARDDQAYLQGLSDKMAFFTISITYASGETFSGQGVIVGAPLFSNQTSSVALSLKGSGKLERQ